MQRVTKFTKHHLITFILIAYLAAVIGLMLANNVSITPDRIFVFLLFAALIIGRLRSFLKDWVPFLALILAYEMLRGFADNYSSPAVVGLIVWERIVFFGYLPTELLQQWFYKPGQIQIHDMAATIIYFLHFPLPLLTAFYLWLKNKSQYYQFVIALLVLSFSAFISFLLFPAAPPWYAAERGYIEVTKITNLAVNYMGWDWNLSYYYSKLNPNPVAAMPSLHAAYPFLVLLALRRLNKKIFWYFLPYPFAVWISTFYLGEHYAIDALAGVIYATAAYLVVYHFGSIRSWFSKTFGILGVKPKESLEVRD